MQTRVVIPDSHGSLIDLHAKAAFLGDLKAIDPNTIVMLGDHLDCGGTFSSHQRTYTNEMAESYVDDVAACNLFLDEIQALAPRADIHYIAGNHEAHVERWAARNFERQKDANMFLEMMGPAAVLGLKRRGIHYYRTCEFYQGLSIPGTIRLGKCFFTHGISHAKHAHAVHLERFGASVQFGHIHRAMGMVARTVTSSGHGAWCPGTLAKLQPLYRHTSPTDWTHGYGFDEILPSGLFNHQNVPIFKGGTIRAAALGATVTDSADESPAEAVLPDARAQARSVERAYEVRVRKAVRAKKKELEAKERPTKQQAKAIAALRKHGSKRAAAKAMGLEWRAYRDLLEAAQKRLAKVARP